MLAALNDLEVKAGDVFNAYITVPITEKIWTMLGKEFGHEEGKTAIIVRARSLWPQERRSGIPCPSSFFHAPNGVYILQS